MNKLLIIPIFFLTMCGTAPVTPPAEAIPQEQMEQIWEALEYMKEYDILQNRTDVPTTPPMLQMGKIEPILAPLIQDNLTLKERLANQNLAKELDSMIVGSGNVNTSNISNVNNFPGGFKPDNDFITAVIMGDKRAKMS